MVNTYEVKITQQAQEQMEEIVNYVSRELFAPEAAKSLLNKLENTIMSLSVFPEKHKLTDEEPWRSIILFLIRLWIPFCDNSGGCMMFKYIVAFPLGSC